MKKSLDRREFLKAVSAAAGAAGLGSSESFAANGDAPGSGRSSVSATPALGSTPYDPHDYPIEAKTFTEVVLKDEFWQPKMRRNAEVTIPFEIQKFEDAKRPIQNNVLQAAIYSLRTYPDAKMESQVEASVASILATRDGERGPRTDGFEVATAYYVATGKRDLLDHAIKSADSLYTIYASSNPPFSGGERDAINCVALYRATDDKRYLDLAKQYLDIRGLPNSVDRSRHNQSYMPVLEQSQAVGHAVNDASLMVSLVDVGTLTGLKEYFDAANRIWTDVVEKKLYITGGIGSSGNEGFGPAYSLPNLSAYAETCAAIMFTTFNHKMFLATGDSKYIDVMERAMYNNVLDGVGATGDTFFYVNRLASASDGRNVRWKRASLECCPPNLVRFMASMPGYIFAQRGSEVFVNLYVGSATKFRVGEREIALDVESDMPWEGRSRIRIRADEPTEAAIRLRIPGWLGERPVASDLYAYAEKPSGKAAIAVNGQSVAAHPDGFGYVRIERTWRSGDELQIEFPLGVRKVVANANVHENRGRVAMERGPIVYCAEWPDLPRGKALTAQMSENAEWKPAGDKDLLGGATVLRGQTRSVSDPDSEAAAALLIPYHLWANRGAGEMAVWLSKEEYVPGDIGPAGGYVFYVNKNWRADGWRYLEAAPFDQSEGAPWGSFRVPMEGAKGSAIGTGRQNTAEIRRNSKTPGNAAELCANFRLNGFDDWYLPSFDELREMYAALWPKGLGGFPANVPDNLDYWSSTQVTTDMARHVDFADNGMRGHFDDKDFPRRVRAIRSV